MHLRNLIAFAALAVGVLAFSPMAAMALSPPDDVCFLDIVTLDSDFVIASADAGAPMLMVECDRTAMLPDLVPSTGGEDEDDAAGPCTLTATLPSATPAQAHRLHEDPGRCGV